MRNTLTMDIVDSTQDLLETAFNLTGTHATLFYRRIEITTGTKLHNLTPLLILILDEIHRFDDVDMM